MSASLPPQLNRVAAWCGVQWPHADERAMRRSARAWREAAAAEADLAARVAGAAEQTADRELRAEADELAAVARECRAAADRLDHAAEQFTAAKGQLLAVLRVVAGVAEAVSSGAAAPPALHRAVRYASAEAEQVRRALRAAVDPTSGVRIPPMSAEDPAGGDIPVGGENTGPVRIRPAVDAQQAAQRNRRSPLRPLPARPAGYQQRPLRSSRGAEAVAFALHQFPIGYLPVAASGPSSQDCAGHTAGTYPPRDHPRADLVGDAEVLRRAASGPVRAPAVSGPVEPPAEIVAGARPPQDPGEPEDRPNVPEPAGVAVVLEPDLELDLLGSGAGRVAFAAGTPFAQRALPDEHLHRGYRRYRVVRGLPAWCSTAPPGRGRPGGGVRYRTTCPITDLVGLGYLVELGAAEDGEADPQREPAPAQGRERPARPAGAEAATLRIGPGAQGAST